MGGIVRFLGKGVGRDVNNLQTTQCEHCGCELKRGQYTRKTPDDSPADPKRAWCFPCFGRLQEEAIHRYQLRYRDQALFEFRIKQRVKFLHPPNSK